MRYLAFLLFFNICFGQVYPPAIHLDNVELETYSQPTEFPNYLEPYTNRYGNTVTRISDADVFGTEGQRLGNNYSKDQCWNADNTLVKLSGYPAAILDAETYELLYWANIPSYGRWSNIKPHIIYGTSGDKFVQYNVVTGVRTTLHRFDYSVDFGYGEGNQSHDDRYVGLIGGGNLIVYDLVNDTFVARELLEGDLDWFSVSPSGRYAVAQWRTNGNGINQGMKLYDIDLTNERHLTQYTQHGNFLQLSNGQECIIQFGNSQQWDSERSLEMINLDTEVTTDVFHWDFSIHGNSGIWGGHISSAYDVKDWVFISEGCCYNHETLPSENFAYNPLTNEIRRYGKNHSRAQAGYLHEARMQVNRDGTKMIYTSNYFIMDNIESGHAFVTEVPQETLSNNDFNVYLRPLKIKYYNLLGQQVKKPLKRTILIEEKTYNNRIERKKVIIL